MQQPDPAIGLAIRRARERLRMTQQQLADSVGVSLRSVSNWELGHHVPRNRTVVLEDVLGISLTDEPSAVPGITATDEWEAAVLADDDLPDKIKLRLITDSRAARAAYAAARQARQSPAGGRSRPAAG